MSTGTIDRLETARMVWSAWRPSTLPRSAGCCSIPGSAPRCGPGRSRRPRPRSSTASPRRSTTGTGTASACGCCATARRALAVGRGGLQYTYTAGLHDVEAAWAIVPERWGQGLATELALACVEVGFEQLGLRQIVAFTLPDNVASRRVMEKAGFEYERDIVHVGLAHVLYVRRAPV